MMICALVCNGACIGLYLSLCWSVFECIWIILVNVLALVLASIEKKGMCVVYVCTNHYFIHTKCQCNTC